MIGNCYKFIWSGGKKAENRVGLAVAEQLVGDVIEVNSVNDRIISCTVILLDLLQKLISLHCPQSQLAAYMNVEGCL